jgi:GTPase
VSSPNFIDHVRIYAKSGNGGAGSTHFRREKFIEKGGPDGGDGGRGGHVILKGNRNLWTLLHLRYRKHVSAGNGDQGGGARRSGKQGKDEILEVPPGTIAFLGETLSEKAEITAHDEEIILMEGGRGGLGNWHFRSSKKQAPKFSQPGEPGVESLLTLELKLLADVGLVGFPNAGKSTLLAALSEAKPKIADYPFTTLSPNLGVVSYRGDKSFVMADIPGIIEGASEGKGLGLRFLRHIERNSILLFMIPSDSDDIIKEYKTLLNELKLHNPELLKTPRIMAVSKSDLLDQELEVEILSSIDQGIPYLLISSVSGNGITQLKDLIWKCLQG